MLSEISFSEGVAFSDLAATPPEFSSMIGSGIPAACMRILANLKTLYRAYAPVDYDQNAYQIPEAWLQEEKNDDKRNPSDELLAILAKNVKRLRKERDFTQATFSELCGFYPTFLSMVERKQRNVTISTL